MNYGAVSAIGANAVDSTDARPETDLESLLNNLKSAASFGQELNALLAQIIIRARGSLPPGPENNAKQLQAVPSGILGELRESHETIKQNQAAALDLIQIIRTLI